MDDRYKRKVLMFAYDYPPRGGSGVQRTVKFVRYLPEYDWEPIVVAPMDWYRPAPFDYSFSDEVAHAVTIRTKVYNSGHMSSFGHVLWKVLKPILAPLGRDEEWLVNGLKWRMESFFFPDVGVTWLPFALYSGIKAVHKYKPQVIYATAPPYSTLVTALILAKLSNVPLVVDLRDLWIDNPLRIIKSPIKKRIDKLLERIVLTGSSAIVTTTQSGAKWLVKKYPQKNGEFFTIYNGYDENDFAEDPNDSEFTKFKQKLTISHVGSLYGDISPEPFLKGLTHLLKHKSLPQLDIVAHFVGEVSQFKNVFKAYEYLGMVEVCEAVDHAKAIKIMKESDILLLLLAEGHKKVIPGKVFEYFASGCPIFAIVPLDGETAELVTAAGNAWVVDVKDEDGIVGCLSSIYKSWQSGQDMGKADERYVKNFERRALTSQLSKIFTSVACKHVKS